MNCYLPEGLHPQPDGYTKEELRLAMAQRRILQATAVRCDERHDLHVQLGCCEGLIPRAEAAHGITGGQTRDIAILSRVGRPVCFHVTGFLSDGRAVLSRRSAQEQALDCILQDRRPGDILPAVVTGLAPFGAFCDIGCGAPALLGLREICVSRIQHPSDCLHIGQQLYTVLRSLDPVQRRVWLTQRELLGTWEENAVRFRPGQTVAGIVRARQPYGVFVEVPCLFQGDPYADPGYRKDYFCKAVPARGHHTAARRDAPVYGRRDCRCRPHRIRGGAAGVSSAAACSGEKIR